MSSIVHICDANTLRREPIHPLVPSHGSVHLLATRAAIACIEPHCEEWTAPRDCRPAKLSVTTCRCLVTITNVLAPKLVIPNIKSSLGERTTLGDFGDPPFQILIPLKMIKPHINLESIRTTAFADHTNNLADQIANNQAKQFATSIPANQHSGEVSRVGTKKPALVLYPMMGRIFTSNT